LFIVDASSTPRSRFEPIVGPSEFGMANTKSALSEKTAVGRCGEKIGVL
jgi:hypothetical protein